MRDEYILVDEVVELTVRAAQGVDAVGAHRLVVLDRRVVHALPCRCQMLELPRNPAATSRAVSRYLKKRK